MEEVFKLYQELRSLFSENDPVEEFRQQIHRIVQETIDQIPDGTRIVIRPAGKDTARMLELFDFSRKNVVGIVDQKYCKDDYCGYPCYTAGSFPVELYDCVIISNYYYRHEIKEELETLRVPYIDFFDELEKRGIQLQVPYYFYEEYPQIAVNYFYLQYLRSEVGPQREIALNTLLQIAVEYKDFVLISKIYQGCGGEDGKFPILKDVWRKTQHLLDCIQNKLHERKQKDIILFWTDQVPYSRLHYFPETMKLSKQGTLFQRAYASAPHTNPVLRSMFRGMLSIDDFPQNQEKIDSGNSSLIRFMENKGYKVRLVGGTRLVMGKEHLIAIGDDLFETCGVKWWKGIVDLLRSSEPCFYLFHFMESHMFYSVPDLEKPTLVTMLSEAQQELQVKAAFGYLDQCILLYHQLIGNKTQIFLSDHGYPIFGQSAAWNEQWLHPYCFVVGENIPKITVTRFFPYTNFEKLVQWIVDPTHHSLDDVCADEVTIQDTDYYSPMMIDELIRGDGEKYGLAFRGIFNYNYKYVINSLGDESFYQMQPDGTEKQVPLEDLALREELRDKAGTKFLDVYQIDKFCHTRKLYESINQKRRDGNAT